MVAALRQRERERLQNSLSREELFSILITWSVPISHLTEVERRKRTIIVDNFHRHSAQQLIHAMFVGKKVRAERKAATTTSRRRFMGAAKVLGRAMKPSAQVEATNHMKDDNFDEIQCIKRVSSEIPSQRSLSEEQHEFLRMCIKSKSQMISSKKILQKVLPLLPSICHHSSYKFYFYF